MADVKRMHAFLTKHWADFDRDDLARFRDLLDEYPGEDEVALIDRAYCENRGIDWRRVRVIKP